MRSWVGRPSGEPRPATKQTKPNRVWWFITIPSACKAKNEFLACMGYKVRAGLQKTKLKNTNNKVSKGVVLVCTIKGSWL